MECKVSSGRQISNEFVTIAGKEVTQTNKFAIYDCLYIIMEK